MRVKRPYTPSKKGVQVDIKLTTKGNNNGKFFTADKVVIGEHEFDMIAFVNPNTWAPISIRRYPVKHSASYTALVSK